MIAEARCIEGLIEEKEGEFLHNLAKQISKWCIVEIGSWKGRSTAYIASGTKLPVYSIDHHKGSEELVKYGIESTEESFRNNTKNFENIIPIVKSSQEARKNFNNPIGMLFIDANHDYEYVKQDYELWSPLVINGGYIAFHDHKMPGVMLFLKEIKEEKNYFENICYIRKGIYATSD